MSFVHVLSCVICPCTVLTTGQERLSTCIRIPTCFIKKCFASVGVPVTVEVKKIIYVFDNMLDPLGLNPESALRLFLYLKIIIFHCPLPIFSS